MLLAIDIGNSNVVAGLFDGTGWKQVWRFPTLTEGEASFFYSHQLSDRFLESGVRLHLVDRVVISSVVPNLTAVFGEVAHSLFGQGPLVVGPGVYPYLGLTMSRPSEIGTDLVANAVAALWRYQSDCIVVDFGTALTFTTVSREGEILGVAIAPGLKTAIQALFQKTAQLPEVPLELPPTPIGKDTVHAIQSGVLRGYVGLVRHMVQEIRLEAGSHYLAVATGGLSSILHPLRDVFEEINPNLTLDGLLRISELADLNGPKS
ncbi:MAG: type III pantothenate kinase [Haliscomenobacter sp.]|nr:type III pantothenate kinase [Haliscomenobacter sp.]